LQLKQSPQGVTREQLALHQEGQWQSALKTLIQKQWVDSRLFSPQQGTNNQLSSETNQHSYLLERGLLLNTEQQQAVDHTDGPLLIIAGPGTGKTHTLTQRIANRFQL